MFSAGSPVTDPELLSGRLDQIRRLLSTVAAVGQHAIIYGERGAGKTSVATLLHRIWANATRDNDGVVVARAQCEPNDTFETIWRKASTATLRDFERRGIEPLGNGRFEEVSAELESNAATPDRVTSFLDLAGKKSIIVIDEFDTVEDADVSGLMATTIKQLSDFTVDTTLVLVGVADSVDDLMAEHASVDRCLNQVFMPRMSIDELRKIVEDRLSRVGMGIHAKASLRIAALSQGLPFYAHLLGLHAAYAAIDAGYTTVELGDVDTAIGHGIAESQQSTIAAYTRATHSTRPRNLYRQTLLACALATGDDLGYFAPAQLQEPMSAILGRPRTVDSFMKQVNALTRYERGPALGWTGDPGSRRFRFINPLLKPYVVLRGIEDRLIREHDAYSFTQPDVAKQLEFDLNPAQS